MRDYRLDCIRLLALLMVITVHTWSLSGAGSVYPAFNGIYHAIEDCGVPLFVMISGALLLPGNIVSVRSFYKKRLTRVLLPFLVWATVVYILSVVMHKYDEITTWQDALLNFIPYMLTNRINYAYWYVQMIVALYLLTPFLQRMLQGLDRNTLRGVILAWGILLTLKYLWPSLYFLNYTSSLLQHIGFYIVGYYISQYLHTPDAKTTCIAAGLFVAGFAGYACGLPASMFWRIIECVGLMVLLMRLPNRENRFLAFTTANGYTVYLIHFLAISPIYNLLHFSGATSPSWQCALIPITTTLVITAGCYLFCYIIRRLGISSRFV